MVSLARVIINIGIHQSTSHIFIDSVNLVNQTGIT